MIYFETILKATDAITSKLHIHTITCGLIEDLWTLQTLSSDFRFKNSDSEKSRSYQFYQ